MLVLLCQTIQFLFRCLGEDDARASQKAQEIDLSWGVGFVPPA